MNPHIQPALSVHTGRGREHLAGSGHIMKWTELIQGSALCTWECCSYDLEYIQGYLQALKGNKTVGKPQVWWHKKRGANKKITEKVGPWNNLWRSRGGSKVNLCPRAVLSVLNLCPRGRLKATRGIYWRQTQGHITAQSVWGCLATP